MGLVEAFTAMKKIILPAVLVSEGPAGNQNGVILRNWCVQNGIQPEAINDEQLTEALVRAVTAQAEKLAWVTPPAKVKLLTAKDKNTDVRRVDQNEFANKVKAGEAAAEKRKVSDAAMRSASELIDAVQIVRNGKIMYGQTEIVKGNLRKELAKGTVDNAVEISQRIKSLIAGVYEKEEKASERMR
jgi:hypothetical protein